MSYAVASIELEAKLKYKDGILVLASKMCKVKKYYNREEYSKNSDLYKKDRKPYLTVARDIQLYKTCNKKSKSFIVKRGEKAKILKCYIGNKHVMYQIKTKSGKQGWFYTDNKVTVINNKLFEEIVYAG